MKKTMSVILAALLLVCCLPFSVFAEETIVPADTYASAHNYVLNNANPVYTVEAGKTFTVPEGITLYIDQGATLEVYGTLNAEGSVISRGGKLLLKLDTEKGTYGKLVQSEDGHVGGNDPTNYRAEVVFSNKNLDEYTVYEHHIGNVKYTCSKNGSSYADVLAYDPGDDSNANDDPDYSDATPYAALNYNVPTEVLINQYLTFKMDILDEKGSNKKYDANKLVFKFNDVNVKNAQNVNQVYVTTAGVISFAGSKSWNEDTFLRTFRIYIPSGTGYSVYGINGEVSAETETVRLKYGTDFTFRVDIDSEYSRSETEREIYLINTYQFVPSRYSATLAEMAGAGSDWNDVSFYDTEGKYPCVLKFKDSDGSDGKLFIDENGFCHIPGEYINCECSIAVTGVAKNETITFAAKIVNMLRSIVDQIRDFFEYLATLFTK